ncbi:lysophospholipid acyltransferase family protein [Parvicella tangerina]|uniref:Phospholipid/glycerol acyltransferase domain-containing protein n=1 Tax=Parvicella tangerina TaxID=2829795 RepID=A0A916JJU6_9FLAO|nr:lysophospholipid acyltransferase family protein [Parvicella tangerina]CAG5076573.1 hypothetical protein CRYO30217_00141 [Parvicella tangerina]
MVYKVLKVLVKLTMYFFFRKRIVLGADHVPKKGPTILVANHPVTFLDPLLVAVTTGRQVHFLAKGAMFKNKLIRAVFKAFNMIPIYRAQDNPGDMSKNQDTFKYCYEHLEKGEIILIFPEGISVTDRTLKPLKTGVARIALGAEARNDFKLGVQIVPFGLTYEAPHQFRKDVLVSVGKPIRVNDYRKLFLKNDRDAVHSIMEEVKERLESLTLNVNRKTYEPVVDFLINENAIQQVPFEKSVETIKSVLLSIDASATTVEAKQLVVKMNAILEKKKQAGLQKATIGGQKRSLMLESFVSIFTLIIGVPMLLFGFVHNALPYFLAPRLAKLITKEYEYQGPIIMTAGMVVCLITYPVFFCTMLSVSGSVLLSIVYLVSIPIIGITTYGFFKQLSSLKLQWKLLFLFNKRSDQIAEIIIEKKELLKELGRFANKQVV